jgi:hypothetical protein
VQLPAASSDTLPPLIVHEPEAAYDTGRPELAEAPGAKSGSPYVLSAIGGNVIVWLSFPTTLSVIVTPRVGAVRRHVAVAREN